MSYREIIRAWKDPEFRAGLSTRKKALLPDNPAGIIELNDEDLHIAAKGLDTMGVQSCRICVTVNCPPGQI